MLQLLWFLLYLKGSVPSTYIYAPAQPAPAYVNQAPAAGVCRLAYVNQVSKTLPIQPVYVCVN